MEDEIVKTKSMFDLLKDFSAPAQELKKSKVQYEFQELGLELEPIYGKVIWSLFYKKGFTEFKIRKAHEIAQRRNITKVAYLIGIIKKLPY